MIRYTVRSTKLAIREVTGFCDGVDGAILIPDPSAMNRNSGLKKRKKFDPHFAQYLSNGLLHTSDKFRVSS